MRSPDSTKPKAEPKRFFAPLPEAFASFPVSVTVTDSFVTHHLRTVMRARPGELVVLVDGERELAYSGTLTSIDKHSIQVELTERIPTSADPLPPVTLAVAVIKEQRWDWLLQKTTELGVRQIQPILAERSVIRLTEADKPKKQERWQAVVRSAAEQSEGMFIPTVLEPKAVAQLGEQQLSDSKKILLAERGEHRASFYSLVGEMSAKQPIVLAIGPEGGWTEAEFQRFEAAGFTAASLGQRILRSETAAIAAMAVVACQSDAL